MFMIFDTRDDQYWFETLSDTSREAVDNRGECRELNPTDFAISLATGVLQVHEVSVNLISNDALKRRTAE